METNETKLYEILHAHLSNYVNGNGKNKEEMMECIGGLSYTPDKKEDIERVYKKIIKSDLIRSHKNAGIEFPIYAIPHIKTIIDPKYEIKI